MGSGIRVYPLPPQLPENPYLDQLYGHLQDPQISVRRIRPARRGMMELLTTGGPRIWHVHFFDEITQRRRRLESRARTTAFLALVRLVRARGAKIVWTAHNLEPHELRQPDLAEWAYRSLLRQAAAVIVHSRAAGELLVGRYGAPRRLDVIPIGNWIGLLGPPQDRWASRAHLGWPADQRIIVGLGTLRRYKGFEDLLDAFESLDAGDTRLIIAGKAQDQGYYRELAAQAAGRAHIRLEPGYLADVDLARYLAAADLVVLPYRKLLTSAMVMAPLSYAAPVVAPAFAPVTELLTDGASAFLYPPGSVAGLREALARALQHPDLGAVGQAGQEAVRELDWSASAARTAALYREVAGQ